MFCQSWGHLPSASGEQVHPATICAAKHTLISLLQPLPCTTYVVTDGGVFPGGMCLSVVMLEEWWAVCLSGGM